MPEEEQIGVLALKHEPNFTITLVARLQRHFSVQTLMCGPPRRRLFSTSSGNCRSIKIIERHEANCSRRAVRGRVNQQKSTNQIAATALMMNFPARNIRKIVLFIFNSNSPRTHTFSIRQCFVLFLSKSIHTQYFIF